MFKNFFVRTNHYKKVMQPISPSLNLYKKHFGCSQIRSIVVFDENEYIINFLELESLNNP